MIKEDKKVVHISILGICVLRDIFRIMQSEDYIVDAFVQESHPFSIIRNEKVLEYKDIEESSLIGEGWLKKIFLLDIRRQTFDYLRERKSDYIIIDLGEIRSELYCIKADNDAMTFINGKRKEKIDALVDDGYISKVYKIANMELWTENQINSMLDIYMKRILEIYPREKIILFECLGCQYFYSDSSKQVRPFSNSVTQMNKRVKYAFDYCCRYIPKENIVRMPDYVLSSSEHDWGKFFLHYTNEYYEYGLKAIKLITNSEPDRERKLMLLRDEYSKIYKEKYFKEIWECMHWYSNDYQVNKDVELNFKYVSSRIPITLSIYGRTVHLSLYLTLEEENVIGQIAIFPAKYAPSWNYVCCG